MPKKFEINENAKQNNFGNERITKLKTIEIDTYECMRLARNGGRYRNN